ncbi:hypothetical protein HaLaN_22554 [Haematococcus lacustris]|uniref:Uncharacterized protein n=1 Tax=Haematococcus lacustris TaxID=44745 RepID=A0A699ZPE6_HAELA|nr:hypothetical protein HaLaN_22554 [Haematococcus lacustris]
MASSRVRSSWTMSSPPGVQAGSPQQGRWNSACCAQPGASSWPHASPHRPHAAARQPHSQQPQSQGPALPRQPSAASAPRLSRELSPPIPPRLPKPSQHHSQAGGWTGTAMQR